ncbi:DUF6110 family protein [Pseudoramibacter sp. HA2172]|jgi:hypothetical protein|uniref:DUF6110 family protein n=1 Tax=Pseudoramibacter faecis TaxID=3108534 RepID=UPI002E78CE69|nr:DUF6110 family protein [Pseudoramibacter sp. HA2172]
MSIKGNVLKIGGGFLLGTLGVNWAKSKRAKKASAYVVAGTKIAVNAIKDSVEKCQAGYDDIAADADMIAEKYYADKEAAESAEAIAQKTAEASK